VFTSNLISQTTWLKVKLKLVNKQAAGRGTWDGQSTIHPRNLWVRSLNLTRGSKPAMLPLSDTALKNLTYHGHDWLHLCMSA